MTSSPMKYPRLVLLLMGLSVACGLLGLWEVHTIPKPVACPKCQTCPSPQVASSATPNNPPPSAQKKPITKQQAPAPEQSAHKLTIQKQQAAAGDVNVGGDVHQETKGDCSPATIGSNNTNNCNVPPKINASPQTQIPTGNPAVPWATRFSIQSTALTQLGDLRVTSDGPVLKMEMTRINRDSVCNGSEYVEKLDERTAVFQVCSSEMMAPGHPVTITIYSLNPVRVVAGTFGANSITFQ